MTEFNFTLSGRYSYPFLTSAEWNSGYNFMALSGGTDVYDIINFTVTEDFDWRPFPKPPYGTIYNQFGPTFFQDVLGVPYFGDDRIRSTHGLFSDRINFILPPGWTIDFYDNPYMPRPYTNFAIMNAEGVKLTPDVSTLTNYFRTTDNVHVIVACFTKGSDVLCADGVSRKIEALQAGDLVMTMDHGLLPIRWIGSSKVSAETLAQFPHLRPVRIAANTFGRNRDTRVSPQHRILVSNPKLDLMFGETEALAPAKALVNGHSVTVAHDIGDVEYFHILMDDHEILNVDDMWSESFHPGAHTMAGLAEDTRQEVIALFPQIEDHADDFMTAARLSLKPKEVVVLGL